jgi:FtsZ-binding cell division protein ZapB
MTDKPSIADLAGIDPDFTGGLTPEEYLTNLRAGEDVVALRRERDELRAQADGFYDEVMRLRAEVARLTAENRGLSETIAEWQEIHGTFAPNPEVERLKALLREHGIEDV